jgi:hypothetical protein
VSPARHARTHLDNRIVEAGHPDSLLDQAIEIDIGHDHLLAPGEAFRFSQQLPVLVDHAVAVPRKIGGRLAGSSGGVRIAGYTAPRL